LVVGAANARTTITITNSAATSVVDVTNYNSLKLEGELNVNRSSGGNQRAYYTVEAAKNGAGTWQVSAGYTGDDILYTTLPTWDVSGSYLQVTMPTVTNFSSASLTYSLNAPAVGASLPLQINGSSVTGPILGAATGAAIPALYVGEVITTASAITTTSSTTSEADVTNASITLTPGVWQIFYSVTAQYTSGATSGNSGFLMVTVTDSANTHIGKTERIVYAKTNAAASQVTYTSLAASTVVSIASSTTYKLRQKRTDSSGTGSGGVEVSSSSYDSTFYAIRLN